MKKIALIFMLLCAGRAFSQCLTVSVSGSGAHTGADWNNSLAGLPSTFVRGTIYYLADGTYGAEAISSASGSGAVELRKAQSYDNCSATGWNTGTMGSAQAVFTRTNSAIGISITIDNVIINGNGLASVSASMPGGAGCGGGPSDPTDVTQGPVTPSDCGIKAVNICTNASTNGCDAIINMSGSADNFKVLYMEWQGLGHAQQEQYPVRSAVANDNSATRLVSHVFQHDFGANILSGFGHRQVDHSYFWGNQRVQFSSNHGQYSYDGFLSPIVGITEFNNVYRDIQGTAIWGIEDGPQVASNVVLYNNFIISTSPPESWMTLGVNNGTVACLNGSTCNNFVYVNNTHVNTWGARIIPSYQDAGTTTSGWTIQNNLWYAMVNSGGAIAFPNGTESNNSFLNSGAGICRAGTADVCTQTSGNPFVDSVHFNYKLASDAANWNNRFALGSPYNVDAAGNPYTTDRGAYQFISSSGSMTCSPSTVPANHGGNIALTCTGVGTSWNGSTIFTVTGLAGTSLVSYSNSSSTQETVTIRTGVSTGTATINDATDSISTGITVATSTLSISPTSGNANTTPLLTLTGTNTLWSSEVASTLFSVSGASCSGDSLATPAVTSNTAATATLTTGGALCTITVQDNSTTATATFTVTGLFTLTISTVGVGTTTSSPAGISCPPTCSSGFVNGTAITLTENAALPYFDGGFSNPCPLSIQTSLPCTFTISGNLSITASFQHVQLPLIFVKNTEYIGATSNRMSFPNAWLCAGATTYPSSGSYPNTQAGLQQAVNDAETCRTNTNTGTYIVIAAGSLYSGAPGLVLPQTAGDNSVQFIVLNSSLPLPIFWTVCSHGEQDNNPSSLQPGIRNPGCNGLSMGFQLGSTYTFVPPGAFTLANGILTNTSAYNDVASMYTIEYTGSGQSALSTAPHDVNGISPHHFAILNGEFRPQAGLANANNIIQIGTGTETNQSQLPQHIHLAYDYIHGDWADAPLSGCPSACVATGTAIGTNNIGNGISMGGQYWSIAYSYLEKLLRPNTECHGIFTALGTIGKRVHDWNEGCSINMFSGGFGNPISITTPANYIPAQDIEDRANNDTYSYSWNLAAGAPIIRTITPVGGSTGTGYVTGDSVCVIQGLATGGCGNVTATAGAITAIALTSAGSGYSQANNLSIAGGSGSGALVNITTGYFPNFSTTAGFARKNCHENKIGLRWVIDGNICQNTDATGGQAGIALSIKTDNVSTGVAAATGNYWFQSADFTITNNIFRNTCNGSHIMAASGITAGNGGGIAGHPQRLDVENNLTYNVSVTNPGCGGQLQSGPQKGWTLAPIMYSWTGVTLTENSAATAASTTLPTVAGQYQSQIQLGDLIGVSNCTGVPAFNTSPTSSGNLAIAGTAPAGLSLVFSNSGVPANATDSTCTITVGQGYPANLIFSGNTEIIAGNQATSVAASPYVQYTATSQTPYALETNIFIVKSIFVGGGLYSSTFGEGTILENQAFDTRSFQFNRDVFPTRNQYATGSGCTGAACYTEYGGTNSGASPPVTISFPFNSCSTGSNPQATGTSANLGMVGAMSIPGCAAGTQTTFPYQLADWHLYRLCQSTDAACSNLASLFTGTGVTMAAIDAAQTSTLYVCQTPCGSGPFVDVAPTIPASAPQVMGDNEISEPSVEHTTRRIQ